MIRKAIVLCLFASVAWGAGGSGCSRATETGTPGSEISAANWREMLESRFQIVETFDELQDWDGGSGRIGYNYGSTYGPKKTDGSASRWVYFTNDRNTIEYTSSQGSFAAGDTITGVASGATAKVDRLISENGKTYLQLTTPNTGTFTVGESIRSQSNVTATYASHPQWIANHGADYVWRGSGKSIRINYWDFSGGVAGFGPSRLGTFLGDGVTGKSGFRKIHLFMMVRFQPGFFKQGADGKFEYVGVLKFFELCSGFTAVDYWGTSAEHASTIGTPQVNTEYGANFTVFNINGGGLSNANRLFFTENTRVAKQESGGWGYVAPSYSDRNLTNNSTQDGDIQNYYLNSEWFGLEVAADIGTPNGNDGSIDFWIYDRTGNEKGHFSAAGENRLVQFDHTYNKVTLGGNRICSAYGACPAGQDNRWYADDVIIHSSRIGPTYFSLLR